MISLENSFFNPKTLKWEEKTIENKIKIVTLYEVRYYKEGEPTSYRVGYHAKLKDRKTASKLVKRLKKSNVESFYVPLKIAILVPKK